MDYMGTVDGVDGGHPVWGVSLGKDPVGDEGIDWSGFGIEWD